MDIFLKQVKLIDQRSKFNNSTIDILIKKGIISKIGKKLKAPSGVEVVHQKGLHVSIGWCDIGTQIGEPGYEHRESIATVTQAAAAGGYTAIACFPNTLPCLHSKSEIQYIYSNTKGSAVDIFPIGAISRDCKGEEITEMIDMKEAGAIAFSDGKYPVSKNGVLLRALEYSKSFNGIIISSPLDNSIQSNGVINEGKMSVQLGMPGIPDISEKLMVQRDIELCKYAEGTLVLYNISTNESVTAIKAAQRSKLHVTPTVSYMNLTTSEDILSNFDPNVKVLPPLRTESQRKSMVKAVANQDIEVITSNHIPLEAEAKEKEFFYAAFGAIGLQTSFAAVNTQCKGDITLPILIHALSIGPRKTLQIPVPEILEGAEANLTLFDPKEKWTFDAEQNKSKSANSPYLNQELVGKVKAIIHKNQIIR